MNDTVHNEMWCDNEWSDVPIYNLILLLLFNQLQLQFLL